MKKVTLAVLCTVLFGKLLPYVFLLAIVLGLGIIIADAIKEGKQL